MPLLPATYRLIRAITKSSCSFFMQNFVKKLIVLTDSKIHSSPVLKHSYFVKF